MNGMMLRFYVKSDQKHHHLLLWEWLLEKANELGLQGGSAYRTLGGFGRHHTMREEHFFDLAGGVTIVVEFVVSDEEAGNLLKLMKDEKLHVFYVQCPIQFGILNID